MNRFSRQFMIFPELEILTPKTFTPDGVGLLFFYLFSGQFMTFPGFFLIFDSLKSP